MVRSHGHDCLGPRDFRCAVTAQGELRRVTVLPGTLSIAMSHADHGPPRICHATPPPRNPNVQNSERLHGKGCWPHPRVHSLSRGGPGGHCRNPEDRIPPRTSSKSRRKTRRAHMPRVPRLPSPSTGQLRSRHVPRGSSSHHQGPWQLRDCHVPHGPGSRLLAQDNSGTATCLVAPAPATKSHGSSGTATCPVTPISRLLAQESSGTAT
jgi:hypothetical protein